MENTINPRITSYDDPIFEEINADLNRAVDTIKHLIPINPAISKDDEWNDPEYDKDYEEFCRTHPKEVP